MWSSFHKQDGESESIDLEFENTNVMGFKIDFEEFGSPPTPPPSPPADDDDDEEGDEEEES